MRQTLVQRVGLVLCQDCSNGHEQPTRADALRAFSAAHPGAVDVRVTGCLDRCDYADVLVVRPSPDGRRCGGRPVWFGFADETALDLLRQWIGAGGPGLAEMPAALALHEISRPHRQPVAEQP